MKENEEIIDNIPNRVYKLKRTIKPGEEIKIEICGKVSKDDFEDNQEYIENYFEINGNMFEKIETNIISFKINNPNIYEEEQREEQTEQEQPEQEQPEQEQPEQEQPKQEEPQQEAPQQEQPQQEQKQEESQQEQPQQEEPQQKQPKQEQIKETKKYRISGRVWEDINKNGKFDSEELIEGVNVKLYKSANGTSVVYSSSNLVKETSTNEKGEYKFENLESGYYLVMVEYDSENYNVTEYKVETTGQTTNSDFISKTTTIGGTKKTVAISDILNLNSNPSGI